MKQAIAKLWVKALRSGKYRQTRGKLRTYKGGYCCLGVLTDLHPRAEWVRAEGTRSYHARVDGVEDRLSLARPVMEWAGVKSDNAVLGGAHATNGVSLMYLNDEKRLSFKEIAALIEKNWRKL